MTIIVESLELNPGISDLIQFIVPFLSLDNTPGESDPKQNNAKMGDKLFLQDG